MNVRVEVVLTTKPSELHRDEMHRAASELTNNKKSIKISLMAANTLVAEFTMKTTAQYKVVDRISHEFTYFMEDYSDSMISFSSAKNKKKPKRIPATHKITLEKTVEKFTSKAEQIFALSDILLQLPPGIQKVEHIQKQIKDILDDDPLVFYNNDFEDYHPRVSYFDKAHFLLIPHSQEIEQGILILGHRFIPFCGPDVLPGECKLQLPDGSSVRRKKIRWALEDTVPYNHFFTREQIIGHFLLEDNTNQKVFTCSEPTKNTITFTAFDMKKIYEQCNFKPGDAFVATVLNWKKGIYKIEYFPATRFKRYSDFTRRSYRLLENAFEYVFECFEANIDTCEQIARAFFITDGEVIEFPGIHIESFLQKSKNVELQPYGFDTIIWRKQKSLELEHRILTLSNYPEIISDIYMLDIILDVIGKPFTHIELEAFMRDGLYQGKDIVQIVDRCFPLLESWKFNSKEREQTFYRLVRKLWKIVNKDYDITQDKKIDEMRSKALKIFEKHCKWTYFDYKLMFTFSYPRELAKISEITQELRKILQVFNIKTLQTSYRTKIISQILQEIAEDLEILESKLPSTAVKSGKLPSIRESKIKKPETKSKAPDISIYQLKISLLGTQPTIWRRMQIHGHTPLVVLHHIIQIIMGWGNCHLHAFYTELFATQHIEDEENLTLSHLVGEAGETFFYEYDFGDRWQHEISLEKILSRPKWRREYPLCIDGNYVCPPEDCGGVDGFQHLLHVMKNKKRTREYSEMVKWLGKPFKLSRVDVNEINRQLHHK